jgi:hypothetical protein
MSQGSRSGTDLQIVLAVAHSKDDLEVAALEARIYLRYARTRLIKSSVSSEIGGLSLSVPAICKRI